MYSMLGNEVNLHIDWVILIMGRLGLVIPYPGHIGLGNRPHMYSMLGKEVNLWIGLFLLWGG